jgi:hypothetical protein
MDFEIRTKVRHSFSSFRILVFDHHGIPVLEARRITGAHYNNIVQQKGGAYEAGEEEKVQQQTKNDWL